MPLVEAEANERTERPRGSRAALITLSIAGVSAPGELAQQSATHAVHGAF